MKTRTRIYLSLIISVLFGLWIIGALPVKAQEPSSTGPVESLETILARAAARGFLVTLTRPELTDTMKFYLLDSIDPAIVTQLQTPPVTEFEINQADWVSEVTYQVKATLQPGDRSVAVYTGKYNGRWRVEGIDLPAGPAPAVETAASGGAAASTSATAGGAVVPIRSNGTGKLVFQTQSGGGIYLINADGTGLRQITHGIDPQLSPDGSQIAFTRWEPRYELFTINVDGGEEYAWTHGWRQMKSPTWSADGSRLVFSWQNGGRLEGKRNRINLTQATLDDDTPRIPAGAVDFEIVKRDGQTYLYYYLPADAHWSLKQVDLGTAQMSDLLTEQHSYGPSGHPTEANKLVYRGNNGIALHNLEAGTDQIVTTDARDHTPVISPDGRRIAVSYWQDGHWEVHVMNLDGSGRQRLTTTPLAVIAEKSGLVTEEVMGKERIVPGENPWWNNAAPTWSPDGSKIAFVTDRRGKWEIWIMNADGSEQRPMFSNEALDSLTLYYAGVDERMLSWR